ncbi:hypothetical protein ACM5Q9_03475 [Advenella sp. RU8]|uniref:hypothetical protein n=1 Tax=Advenella sp. RU8 TaxID=3399575 RepID=UPI003AB0CF17
MHGQSIRILVLIMALVLTMPVFAKERLQQVASQILRSLKLEPLVLAQEMKLFGQAAFTTVFTQEQPLDVFMQEVQNGKTVFNYADVIGGHVFLHAGLDNAHALLHLFATSENGFRGELSLIEKPQSGGPGLSAFNEMVAKRYLPWMPAGAQLLMDIELPGPDSVLQQLYQLEHSESETRRQIKARLLNKQWVPDREVSLGMDCWHKGNESLYLFIYGLQTGTGLYLMKKNKQAE